MLLSYVTGGPDPMLGFKYPEVRITNPRDESCVVSVLDTWEEAIAEADRLNQELYEGGVSEFCEKYMLPETFGV